MTVRAVSRSVRALAAGAGVLVVLAFVTLAPWLSPASAAPVGPVNPLAPAQGFNVMTEADATLVTNETEGPIAVGGNLHIGGTYQVALVSAGSYVAPGDTLPTGLLINGAVSWASSAPGSILRVVNANGLVKIGDSTGTFVRNLDNNSVPANTRVLPADDYNALPHIEVNNQQSTVSVTTPAGLNFAAAFASFRQSSTALAACANTVVLTDAAGTPLPSPIPPGTDAVVGLQPNVTNVLNLSAADYNNIATLTFPTRPTATSPLLINVDTAAVANTFVMTAPNFGGLAATDASFVLVNIPTATTLSESTGAATVATILAPNASYTDTNPSNVEGQVVTRSFSHGLTTRVGVRDGEVHYHVFSAQLSCDTVAQTASPSAAASVTGSAAPSRTPPAPSRSPVLLPTTGAGTAWLFAGGAALLVIGLIVIALGRLERDTAKRSS